jgi:hypothetical protein
MGLAHDVDRWLYRGKCPNRLARPMRTARRGGRPVVRRATAFTVLGLSACGYPLTQLMARRWGRPGAVVAESVSAGLAIRDAAMVAGGAPGRLRPVPAALLRLELAAGIVASLAGLPPLLDARPPGRPAPGRCSADTLRRAAVAALFALHTIRFGIYLSPGQGRRASARQSGR